jgi:hypothetical protein
MRQLESRHATPNETKTTCGVATSQSFDLFNASELNFHAANATTKIMLELSLLHITNDGEQRRLTLTLTK